MKVRGSRSREEIASFLDTQTIPVRLGCRTPAGHPWMVSLWYRSVETNADTDTDGDGAGNAEPDWCIECATAASADVVSYLRETSAVAFEISTNQMPYAGVRGRGEASIEPDPEKTVLRSLLERYLGGADSALARDLLREDREEVTITVEPAVVYGWDFSSRM
jgi:hypothetical protein